LSQSFLSCSSHLWRALQVTRFQINWGQEQDQAVAAPDLQYPLGQEVDEEEDEGMGDEGEEEEEEEDDDDLDDDAEVDLGEEEAPTASRQAFDTNVGGPQVGMNVLG
jgi:hypothetical protein